MFDPDAVQLCSDQHPGVLVLESSVYTEVSWHHSQVMECVVLFLSNSLFLSISFQGNGHKSLRTTARSVAARVSVWWVAAEDRFGLC